VLERQSTKLTSDRALPQFESRHIKKSRLDGIWCEIRARWIHCTSIKNEMDFLEEKRRGFPDFVRKIDVLDLKDKETDDARTFIGALLKEYDRYASYYPSYKKLHEANSAVVTPHFITRINALQSWARFQELSLFVLKDLEFLMENNRFYNPELPLLDQSDDFYLSLIQDDPLRHCYQAFVDRDISIILPKLRSIFDTSGRALDRIGLQLDVVDISALVLAAPVLQIRGLSALTQYAEMAVTTPMAAVNVENVIEAVISRFQTMISVRERFFSAGLMEWIPSRYT
jgi:hypothetical protein